MCGIALIFVWCFLRWRRLWIPCTVILSGIGTLSFAELRLAPRSWLRYFPTAPSEVRLEKPRMLRLSFLDVGQGDCIVMQFPDSSTWLIDAGGLRVEAAKPEDASPFDIGEAVVSRFLWSRWIVALDLAVLSHPHQDHAGGMPAVLQNFSTRGLHYADAGSDPVQSNLLALARSRGVPVHDTRAGMEYGVAGVAVRVLNPASSIASTSSSTNDGSVVLHVTYGAFSALLPGDLEGTGEASLLERTSDLRSSLFKVAHHGSRNASLNSWLDRVQPRWAIISAGRNNPFGNPARETLIRLLRHKARLLLTMDQGAIFFETDGVNYKLASYNLGILEQGPLVNRH